MANCSFIQATEARNIARNNTLIWEEICAVQTQILAAIDGNLYSVLVTDATPFTATQSILSAAVTAGGSSYLPVVATATIGAGGTGGIGALVTPVVTGTTITSFIIDNGGTPVMQTASINARGTGYSVNDVLTDASAAALPTPATITVNSLSTIALQDETDYAASFSGTAVTGAYVISDVITLDDGSTITVDNVAAGDVTEFTVPTATTIGITGDLATVSQLGAVVGAGNGTGFTLTQQLTNQGVFGVTIATAGDYSTSTPASPIVTTVAPAGGTGATLDVTFAAGYAPVSVTASIDNANDLIDAQDETNFDNVPANGTFNAGDSYRVGEVISLVDASTVTVAAGGIAASGVVNTIAQDETDYAVFVGGDGVGGTAYVAGDVITMSDGSTVTVDTVDGNGDVVTFDITTASTSSYTSGALLTQVGNVVGLGNGLAFTLTSAGANEITVGSVTLFDTASPGSTPYYQTTLLQLSTDGIGSGFTLTPAGNNQVTSVQGTGVSLVVTETSGAVTNVTAAGGSGYLVGASLTFAHPTGINAAATVTSVLAGGVISGITISNGGSGYEQAVATVTVVTPDPAATPAIAFAGTVVTSNGFVTGISIQEGGLGYAELLPTVSVTDAGPGTGAVLTTVIAGGEITAINVDAGGSGYAGPTLTIVAAPTSSGVGATATATIGTNTWGTTPTEYHDVLAGLDSNAVISDQIQYILDYFTSLGYNIRAQTNSTTTNTMQWQIIW